MARHGSSERILAAARLTITVLLAGLASALSTAVVRDNRRWWCDLVEPLAAVGGACAAPLEAEQPAAAGAAFGGLLLAVVVLVLAWRIWARVQRRRVRQGRMPQTWLVPWLVAVGVYVTQWCLLAVAVLSEPADTIIGGLPLIDLDDALWPVPAVAFLVPAVTAYQARRLLLNLPEIPRRDLDDAAAVLQRGGGWAALGGVAAGEPVATPATGAPSVVWEHTRRKVEVNRWSGEHHSNPILYSNEEFRRLKGGQQWLEKGPNYNPPPREHMITWEGDVEVVTQWVDFDPQSGRIVWEQARYHPVAAERSTAPFTVRCGDVAVWVSPSTDLDLHMRLRWRKEQRKPGRGLLRWLFLRFPGLLDRGGDRRVRQGDRPRRQGHPGRGPPDGRRGPAVAGTR